MAPPLQVTRLLQNPLRQPAPEGAEGDIVRVTDGLSTIYLTPDEYAHASEIELRQLLAATPSPDPDRTGAFPHPEVHRGGRAEVNGGRLGEQRTPVGADVAAENVLRQGQRCA